jgi:HemK-like putative methylase
VAKQNTTIDIDFQQGSWFAAVPDRQFDLIISNPPYIEQDDPCLKDLIHEPQTALVSGKDGLDDIRIIIKQAPQHLTNNGTTVNNGIIFFIFSLGFKLRYPQISRNLAKQFPYFWRCNEKI